MEDFFIEFGNFDHIDDNEYQISYVVWRDGVKGIVPEGAKHLVVNNSDSSVAFWDDSAQLKIIKVVAITLEDGTTLTKEG